MYTKYIFFTFTVIQTVYLFTNLLRKMPDPVPVKNNKIQNPGSGSEFLSALIQDPIFVIMRIRILSLTEPVFTGRFTQKVS